MGFITELNKGSGRTTFPGGNRDRLLWRTTFGQRSKEDLDRQPPVRGGSYGRSLLSSDAAFKRLLQAMRSLAPGGWSDDRWEQSKHFTGIQYVVIHRTGEMMAQAEFCVFERDEDHPEGKKPVKPDHPLVKLLERPNRDDSFGDLMYRWNQQMDLTGKALTWMVPNQLGTPMELYSIPTAIAIPQPAINPDYPDGYYRIQPLYPYGPFSSYPTPSTAVGAPIPADWMLEFKYPHPLLRYDGYAPLTALRLHIDEIEAMDRSRWYSMKRTFNPSAVLNFEDSDQSQPMPEPEIERIKAEFENETQSPENVGKLYVSAPGARLEPWGAPPRDMEYQAGWEQLVSFVMAGFGITKPAAGMIEDASYAVLFATLKQLHLLTLEPKCNRIARKLTRHLAPFYGDNLIIEIRCQRIDDHDVKNAKLNVLIAGRAITKNELRRDLDMPVTEEDWGEEIAGTEPQPTTMPGLGGEGGEQGGGGMEQLMGMMPGGAPGQGQGGPDGQGNPEEEEPQEVTQGRPQPGNLGQGALGPRKSLQSRRKSLLPLKPKKSVYERVREVISNGH